MLFAAGASGLLIMTLAEDISLQKRFRHLEWGSIALTVCVQLLWVTYAVFSDNFISISYGLLFLTAVISYFTPTTTSWRLAQLIAQTTLVTVAGALGDHHFYYLNLYVFAAKAAVFLPRKQMLAMAGVLTVTHILAGQISTYDFRDMHVRRHPVPRYYRVGIVEGQGDIYFVITLFVFTLLGKNLIEERRGRTAEKYLCKEVEALVVNLERARIARDIHDGLGHTLTSLKIQLELTLKLLQAGKPEEALNLLRRSQESAASSLAEIRKVVASGPGEDFDLTQAITKLLDQIKLHSAVNFKVRLDEVNIAPQAKHQILSIVQECLTNIRKHALASEVEISLAASNGLIRLGVKDNGKGFDMQAEPSGFGLKGLSERAQTVGGTIKIQSSPGGGTEIALTFPQQSEAGKTLWLKA
jgi:signal transduction histidine kinase